MPVFFRQLKLWLATLSITLLAIELLTFSSTLMFPSLYDTRERRDSMFATFNQADYANYIDAATGMRHAAHPVTGWGMSFNNVKIANDCIGTPKTYTNLSTGIRAHIADAEAYIKSNPTDGAILLAGDSYTYGAEANDEETYPAQLEKKLGVKTVNLGVIGFCPLQALLKLEEDIDNYPKARIVVLGIMYEDMIRMLNSYRPAYVHTGLIYGFKPFIEDGRVVPVSGSLWQGFEQMRQAAEIAMDNDYLAKPLPEFPFTVAFVKALTTPYFQYDLLARYRNITGQPKAYYFLDMPGVKEAYDTLLKRYAEFAMKHNLKPVLVFMPANANDTTSGEPLMEYARKKFGDAFVYVSVGKGIDWERYNIDKRNCHPSAYGYERIADAVAHELKGKLGEELEKSKR
jgi:hypothetical protein